MTLLAVPTRGYLWYQTAERIAAFAKGEAVDEVRFFQSKRSPAEARNLAGGYFLASEHSVMVFLDDDVVPGVGACEALAEEVGDWDVVGATVSTFNPAGLLPAVYRLNADGGFDIPIRQITHSLVDVFAVDAVGFGMVALSRRVVEEVGPFRERLDVNGIWEMGEDADFCLRAGEAGFGVGVMPRVICEHVVPVHLNEIARALR